MVNKCPQTVDQIDLVRIPSYSLGIKIKRLTIWLLRMHSGTMPHNPQNPQNLHNFGDPAYVTADDVSMVYTTATNGSEQQIQPSNIHTAVFMHQHSAILNPLNQQSLNSGRFPSQAGPSSAAERIQGWAKDANHLHQRLYERGLSRGSGYHDHTESGG
jgi:hypothetical protein